MDSPYLPGPTVHGGGAGEHDLGIWNGTVSCTGTVAFEGVVWPTWKEEKQKNQLDSEFSKRVGQHLHLYNEANMTACRIYDTPQLRRASIGQAW